MKYFYINNTQFNYNLEFDSLNTKNSWKLNAPLIEYSETLGIKIPHYCYHKNLSIAGNCRMCLIELTKSPKPVVSCAMTARSSLAANTVIYTHSPLIKKARENILEFLLINHPLDCPICDQGGMCDLQDQSMAFGSIKKRFYNFRRIVVNKNVGPIVKTVMSRCIHCTRCVRFANEIACVSDLGIFGRGADSEIGTYVNKLFCSELSGNVSEICPVGALTLKPYAFVNRNWELKSVNSIDISDGFGTNIQIFVKNNKIVKILPAYDKNFTNENWITDKTRFLFDGMFTRNRKLTKTVSSGFNNLLKLNSWDQIFKKLVYTIYFYDHLNRHFLDINQVVFIFDENISIEVLNILMLLNKTLSFLKIRRLKQSVALSDFESSIQLNLAAKNNSLNKADVCLLIGADAKYEGSYLNLKLQNRLSKGSFQVFKFGSVNNLTFKVNSIGTNMSTLKSVAEGTHYITQNLVGAQHLLIISNTNLYKRKDSFIILSLIKILKAVTFLKTVNWNGVNFLSNSINSVGISLLGSFKGLSKFDFFNANIIYFINTSIIHFNVFIELKLLKLNYSLARPKIVIEQNNTTNNIKEKLKSKANIHSFLHLPTSIFFEFSGSYFNTEGVLKKKIQIISPNKKIKNDWQILRKLYSATKKIVFTVDPNLNNRLTFNCNNIIHFKKFTMLLYLNSFNISNLVFCTLSKNNQGFELSNTKFNYKKFILNSTVFKKQVDDFFLGGFDNYSHLSPTMLNCSLNFRLETTNF